MHQTSVSTCSLSPRCTSARPARGPLTSARSSRPGTGDIARLPAPVPSRPGSSSVRQATDLFHLTRPPSGSATSRAIGARLFDEDIVAQRNRLSSARSQRGVEVPPLQPASASSTSVPTGAKAMASSSLPVPTAEEDPLEVPHWTNDSHTKWPARNAAASTMDEPDSAHTGPFSPFDILRTLQRQSSLFRRPSRVPTPPQRPDIEDLIRLGSSSSRRRSSLFSSATGAASCREARLHSGPSEHTQPGRAQDDDGFLLDADDDSGSQLDLADARTGFLEEQFRYDGHGRESPSVPSNNNAGATNELMTSPRAYDARAAINPQHARKRAFYQKLNDVAMIHAGVQLFIPSIQNVPHYQTLHPMEFAREAKCEALPLPLRVEYTASNSSDDHAPPNRGFLTVAQWKREKRSTNFVMPQLYNPGPIEPSAPFRGG